MVFMFLTFLVGAGFIAGIGDSKKEDSHKKEVQICEPSRDNSYCNRTVAPRKKVQWVGEIEETYTTKTVIESDNPKYWRYEK